MAAVVANTHAFRKPGEKPFQPFDFFPGLESPRRGQSPEEMLHMVELWNAALGGADLREMSN